MCALATYAKALERLVIVADVHHNLGATLGELATDRDAIQEIADEQQAIRTQLDGALGKLTEEVSKLSASNSRMSKEIEKMDGGRTEVEEMLRQARALAEKQETMHPERQTQNVAMEETGWNTVGRRSSYAAVAQRAVPLQHAVVMARQGTRDRQVLIDFTSPKDKDASKDMSETELVAKANMAMGLLRAEGNEIPAEFTFISVRKLRHGGCLYEMSSMEAAQWLKRDANMHTFQNKFGLNAVLKERHYPVVLKSMPIGFDPSEAIYRQIELENGWNTRDLAIMHWIKPPKRRREGQQTAFAIAKFSNPKAANAAIMQGLTFRGQKIQAWRQMKEARRCLRCQKLEPGHMAATCTEKEACGTCASLEHTTGECSAANGVFDRYCVNCDDATHASWDRTCPVFAELNRRLQLATPLERYRCFPIPDDPASWEERYISESPICDLPSRLTRRLAGAQPTRQDGPLTHGTMPPSVHPDRARNLVTATDPATVTADNGTTDETATVREAYRHRQRTLHTREQPPHQSSTSTPDTPRETAAGLPTRPRPQTTKIGGKQRQATLTEEGGFTTSRTTPRPASRTSLHSQTDDNEDVELWRTVDNLQ